MEEIIEEREGFRVRLELDDTADAPYDNGQCPILRINGGHIETPGEPHNDEAEGFQRAFNQFYNELRGIDFAVQTFERYLRIFHGTKSFAEYRPNDFRETGYIAFDTKAWLEEIGVTDENPDIEPVDRAEPCLDEVKAWATGDVWGWIVERKVHWQRLGSDGEPVFLTEPNTMETWEEVSSCWGFYGHDYAESAAKEALAITIENEEG